MDASEIINKLKQSGTGWADNDFSEDVIALIQQQSAEIERWYELADQWAADFAGGTIDLCDEDATPELLMKHIGNLIVNALHDGGLTDQPETLTYQWIRDTVFGLLAEIERLKRWKADTEAAYAVAINDECGPDEKHCSCVPALRNEIERLTKTINDGDYAGLRELALIREASGHMKVGLCDLAEAVGKDYAELAGLKQERDELYEDLGALPEDRSCAEIMSEFATLREVVAEIRDNHVSAIQNHIDGDEPSTGFIDGVLDEIRADIAAATAALEAESNQQKESE